MRLPSRVPRAILPSVTTDHPIFDEPPLVEAVFELLVDPDDEVSQSSLESAFRDSFPEFSVREPWEAHEATWEIQAGTPMAQSMTSRKGARLWTADKTRGVLVSPAVMALNVLRPYGKFEDHVAALEKAHAVFFGIAKRARPVQLGHRYLNQIVLSRESKEKPDELFALYPRLPRELVDMHPPVSVLVESSRFSTGIVTSGLGRTAEDRDRVVYTLDLYARTLPELAPKGVRDVANWHAAAHVEVVNAFVMSITAAARIRFKEKR